MKKIGGLISVLILMVVLVVGCGEKEADTFTVGFDQNFPPMGFVGDDGEFTGFDLELAAEVATRLDRELVLQPISWDAKDMELKSENIDCVWNGFTINGREELYTWTDPIWKMPKCLL